MKNKETWRSNDEHRADLRIALYECKRDNEEKTYSEIGKEFEVSAGDAKDLVLEYCRLFNLPEPIESLVKSINRKKLNTENLEKEMIVEGRTCFIISELENTFVVRFVDNYESETVYKDSLTIARPVHLRGKL